MALKKGQLDQPRYIARCFDGRCEVEMEWIGQCLRLASVDPQSGHVRAEVVVSIEDAYKFCEKNETSFGTVSQFFNSGIYRHRHTEKGFLIQFAAVGLQAGLFIVPVECDLPPKGVLTRASQWAELIVNWNSEVKSE
jgi:hypothetical protein